MSSIAEGGGRGALVIVRRCGHVVHAIHWSARKLRRVARSCATAELLAASDAASTLIYLQSLIDEFSYHHAAALFVDSRSLVSLSTSIREPEEAINKLDLAFLRENFTPRALNALCWLPGYSNIADGLTKENRTTAALLLKVCREGLHPIHPEAIVTNAEADILRKSKAEARHSTDEIMSDDLIDELRIVGTQNDERS